MKRFHVHVAVPDISESIRFYSTLFGAEPAVRKDDYAKWMLDDPRVNFAISHRGGASGVNHLGFQVDSDAVVLEELRADNAAKLEAEEHARRIEIEDDHGKVLVLNRVERQVDARHQERSSNRFTGSSPRRTARSSPRRT